LNHEDTKSTKEERKMRISLALVFLFVSFVLLCGSVVRKVRVGKVIAYIAGREERRTREDASDGITGGSGH
jgi:hypothetical protein